jgi:hypothetical protein
MAGAPTATVQTHTIHTQIPSRLVGARYRGPGVFGEALHEAVAEGLVRRTSRRTYSPSDDGSPNSGGSCNDGGNSAG